MGNESIIISTIALIVSTASFIMNCINSKFETKSSNGQLEIEIHKMIANAKNNFRLLCIQLSDDNKPPNDSIFAVAIDSAIEDISNAYEEACAKYLDGKIDKIRFRKLYKNEIKKWVDSNELKNKYILPHTNYESTVKVYTEWFNLEK